MKGRDPWPPVWYGTNKEIADMVGDTATLRVPSMGITELAGPIQFRSVT